jgi:hypothetical protein
MYDFTPLQLFYSAFRCSVTCPPAGVGVSRVGVGAVRLFPCCLSHLRFVEAVACWHCVGWSCGEATGRIVELIRKGGEQSKQCSTGRERNGIRNQRFSIQISTFNRVALSLSCSFPSYY